MTDAATEYIVVALTSAACGSFLTLVTCWLCGAFRGMPGTVEQLDAFTAGVQSTLNGSRPGRLELLESLLGDIADECESVFVDPEEMSPEWLALTRRIRAMQTPQNCSVAVYTEHSQQLEAK